jgi:hypothetical protein
MYIGAELKPSDASNPERGTYSIVPADWPAFRNLPRAFSAHRANQALAHAQLAVEETAGGGECVVIRRCDSTAAELIARADSRLLVKTAQPFLLAPDVQRRANQARAHAQLADERGGASPASVAAADA